MQDNDDMRWSIKIFNHLSRQAKRKGVWGKEFLSACISTAGGSGWRRFLQKFSIPYLKKFRGRKI